MTADSNKTAFDPLSMPKRACAANEPSPLFINTETLLDSKLATARSRATNSIISPSVEW